MSPCEHVKIGDSTGIVCTRGGGIKKKRLCEFCKRQYATRQCDFPIERTKASRKDPRALKVVHATCDAWMCDQCSTAQGPNLDYCPPHERNKLQIMEARLRSRIGA